MLKLKKKTLILGRSSGWFDGPNCIIVANTQQVLVDNLKIKSRSDLEDFAHMMSDAWKQHVEYAKETDDKTQTKLDLEKKEEAIN